MPKFKGLKGVLVFLFLAGLIVMYFFHLSNKNQEKEEDPVAVTAVQEVLARNLSTNYPQTPKEVVKYFSEITKCYYNEEYTDDELIKMADQMLLLYDDELVAYKTHEDYILDLKADIAGYKDNGYKISSYAPSASTDVEFFEQDGYEWARLWCVYTIRASKQTKPIQEVFILRKDVKGHWRIFGWRLVEKNE